MNINTLGIITIGKAPRPDVTPNIIRYLPNRVNIVEIGALDGLSDQDIFELTPKPSDEILTTRISNNTSTIVSKHKVIPLLQEAINRCFNKEAQIILLLCTSNFPKFTSKVPIIEPFKILHSLVEGLDPPRLGVIVPLDGQIEEAKKHWSTLVNDLIISSADPYGDTLKIHQTILDMAVLKPSLIFLDCMGFQEKHRNYIKKITNIPCILPNSMIGRIIAEIL